MKNSVRPPEKIPRAFLARLLNYIRKFAGGDRFENLYNAISTAITILKIKNIRLLDYGCGTMSFSSRLKDDGLISNFIGMDIYSKPFGSKKNTKWDNYIQINNNEFLDKFGKFDIVILIDVLHHTSEDNQEKILQTLARISDFIVVKDHFEYGFFSRQLLRLADWYGNYAYGVNVPKKYFNKKRWDRLVQSANLVEVIIKTNVRVHDGLFGIIIRPKHHFISILKLKLQ